MDTGFFEVLHDGADQHFFAVRGGINVNLRGVAEVLVDQERLIGSKVGFSQVAVQLLLVGEDLHATTAEHVGGANEHGEADFFHRGSEVVCGCTGGTPRHAEVVAACEGLEALTVTGFVDRIAGGAHDGKVETVGGEVGQALFERQGEVDGGLTAELEQDAVSLFPE